MLSHWSKWFQIVFSYVSERIESPGSATDRLVIWCRFLNCNGCRVRLLYSSFRPVSTFIDMEQR